MTRRGLAALLAALLALSAPIEAVAQTRSSVPAVPIVPGAPAAAVSPLPAAPAPLGSAQTLSAGPVLVAVGPLGPAAQSPVAQTLPASLIAEAAKPLGPARGDVASALAPSESAAPAAQAAAPGAPATVPEAVRQAGAAALRDGGRLEPPPGTPSTLAELDVEPEPGRAYLASPEDWRDELFYSVLIDRFARGPNAKPLGDPKSGGTRHGGDLEGLIAKLGYLQALGITTLLLSPVTMGVPEAYHGYAPTHLLAVDPHIGTMEDFKRLVREAHKRGIRVIKDIVINHAGPVFEYKEGSKWAGMGGPPKDIYWTEDLKPSELKDPEHFNRRGEIGDWNDQAQRVNGDFPPNLRDWATHRRETQDALIKIAKWWIKETDVDGLRLDAIRHIDQGFRDRFTAEITAYAKALGKTNILLMPENSTGDDRELVKDLEGGTNSGYGYPEYRRNNRALHGRASTKDLEDSFHLAVAALGSSLGRIVRFIDNHDVYRFLRKGEFESLLHTALAFMMFSMGIPLIYYGTEQGFRQYHDRLEPEGPSMPADPANREDMFPEGQFKSESSAGDKFDASSPTFRWVSRLAALRKAHPALRRGGQWVRWNDPSGPGIYAFSRILDGEEVVVALNTADSPREALMWVDRGVSPPGTAFADELDGAFETATMDVGGGSKLYVSVPGHGVRVLVRKAASP